MPSRSTFRVLFLAALVTLAGCGDSRTSLLLPVEDGIHATWAGASFRGPAVVYQVGSAVELVAHTENGSRQDWGLRVTVSGFTGPGTYALDAGDATVIYVIGLDAIAARYGTTAAGAGTLVVDREEEGRLYGTVRFDADALDGVVQPAGSRAHFEGEFSAILQVPGE